MTPISMMQQGRSPEEDYGLDAVARHNAARAAEHLAMYQEGAKGLGIYHGDFAPEYHAGQAYVHNPPTPRSNTTSDGMRTRSGRSTRPSDSPLSATNRVSKSPAARAKKEKKSKLDRSKTPKLTAPLSVLTKEMTVPLRDIEAYVNRPVEERLEEMEAKKYVTRPMNSFMLYRSAYKERTKQWCARNNHQIISSVTGESWTMEPDEVRNQFDQWAKTERQHHQEAHPNYKFSPSKPSNKRRKGDLSDDEVEQSDLDADPNGEYRGGRIVRSRRQDPDEEVFLPQSVGFESHPYYGQLVAPFEQSQYHQYVDSNQPLPSNISYDYNGAPYDLQTSDYIMSGLHHQQPQYSYAQEMHGVGIQTCQQSLGGFGLPGGQVQDDAYSSTRTNTPMQHFQQYGQSIYPEYQGQYQRQAYQTLPSAPTPQPGSQVYEHQQYLQQAARPQSAIDPTLEAAMEAAAASGGHVPQTGDSHFAEAIDDMTAARDIAGIHEYFGRQSISPTDMNATLAATWNGSDLR